ncbi:MAG: hypothetical protein A3A44_00560 [Candidatus Sungbacteria bacterium RIFCSPLOWO2_01_FULL_60_25]|uniref:N-acetyltransferase domain-containing protein n=1 Tax=Candidatus Sungbacteria bacterium RIFCSPLOWO2_01_FULL_60_25 TaxID=1802281 RepID=A0A1G2LBM3_9BACT|nr:MAG: hypothetical protein A3A44_00560 [Candidatus Sungbacteria bacterium RIFCSPLOWO2_01_FULL_60_25]
MNAMPNLSNRLDEALRAYQTAGHAQHPAHYSVHGETPWDVRVSANLSGGDRIAIRNVRSGDEALLRSFRDELGPRSRELFCPYPWDDESRFREALAAAVQSAESGIDASYLMLAADRPIGHFFLWKAGGNAHSRQHGVEVPELGVAVSDAYHGRGLGFLAVAILKAVAEHLESDAVELTTALSNDAGWNTYRRAGFQFLGMIQNPLEVDVTAVTAGAAVAAKYREERQMVLIINAAKRVEVLQYLAAKRGAL